MSEYDRFFELMTRLEPLRPELEPYLIDIKLGDHMAKGLNSPWVQSIPIFDINRCARENQMYQYKFNEIKEAIEKRDWHSFIWLHERPYRLGALLEAKASDHPPTGEDYWKLVADVWIDSENIWQNITDWRWIWNLRDSNKLSVMMADDLKVYNELPETIQVWRGTAHKNSVRGLSWTLDKDRALWFAKRFRKPNAPFYVAEATVAKKDVKAYFDGRNEKEIVASKVKLIQTETIT